MALFTQTASAATPTSVGTSDMRNRGDITAYVDTYYDELMDDFTGEIKDDHLIALMREQSQKKDTHIVQTKVQGNDVAVMNEDGEQMPFITWGQGWNYTFNVYGYRVATKHQRRLQEVENYGTVQQEAKELIDAGRRTVKYALADVWNRGVSPASGAPFLCIDGMYLIDSARPNPVANTPAWSNLESTSDITEESLFQANLNASNTPAPNGDDMDAEIKMIYIPRAYEKEMWKLNTTPQTVGNAMNDANWAKGRFQYETIKEFTSNIIIYRMADAKSSDNGLQLRWSVRPGLADLNPEDPDIFGKRLRFVFGIGCLDPRRCWRGGALNALT